MTRTRDKTEINKRQVKADTRRTNDDAEGRNRQESEKKETQAGVKKRNVILKLYKELMVKEPEPVLKTQLIYRYTKKNRRKK